MIPSEQNDRLLELAGGCRHEWRQVGRHSFLCCKCDKWQGEAGDAAVGDGHQMTLGEMVRLVDKLWPTAASIEFCFCERWGDPSVILRTPCSLDARFVLAEVGDGDTPEAALAAAILATVDGAK